MSPIKFFLIVLILFSVTSIVNAQEHINTPPQELLTSEEILNSYIKSDDFKTLDNFEGMTLKEFVIVDGEYLMESFTYQIWNGTSWESDYRFSDTYTPEGWLIEEVTQVWNGSQWTNSGRWVASYTINGLEDTAVGQNWNGANWENISRKITTYDLNNRIIEKLTQEWSGTDWENWYRNFFSYYPSGNLETGIYQSWYNSNWNNQIRDSFTWNANNYVLERLTEVWNTNDWENSSKINYTYLPTNSLQMRLHSSWSGTVWENDYQYVFSYDSNGNQIEYLKQIWNSGWKNEYRYLYEYFLSSNPLSTDDLRSSDVYQVWDVVQWQDSLRRSYTYNVQNLFEHILFEISLNGTGWTNYHQSLYSYDSNGNCDMIIAQSWNGSSWENYYRGIYTWLYIVPVEFISFTADVNENNVTLSWTTATETNNQGFEVQRAKTNEGYEVVGVVQGNGTTTEINYYSYIDLEIPDGVYNYRLKQIDFDGSFEYSDVIKVIVGTPHIFSLQQNYPNPFNPSTQITYQLAENSNVVLKVYNLLGKEIAVLVDEQKEAGIHKVNFDASSLPSGVYLYKIETAGLIKTKKMMLLK